ncbi:MAG: class I SAM-dependent methyltransferase [Methylophaga sp.]|nr:class I SAM-dependent methyltransferase [Methylophaga sp.]
MSDTDNTPKLQFSEKYDEAHAKTYFEKHEYGGVWRSLSNWRDHQVARKALKIAGNPNTILDMPCGTGRFWDLLIENPKREIHVSDNSQEMINAGLKYRKPEITSRITSSFQGSAFDLPVANNFVESVFCMRLFHHIGKHEDRTKILAELHRVSSSSVILSLWVDGNFKSWRRKRNEAKRKAHRYQNRFVIPVKTIEDEFSQAGFSIEARLDFVPVHSMWRTYVLKKL